MTQTRRRFLAQAAAVVAVSMVAGCSAPSEVHPARERALGLVTLSVISTPLRDAVEELKRQTSMSVRIGRGVDPAKAVSIQATSMPFHRFFIELARTAGTSWVREEDMETGAEHWELRGKWDHAPDWVVTEGAAISFSVRAYKEGGVVNVRTLETQGTDIFGRMMKVTDGAGKELDVERCAKCGDHRIFVKTNSLQGLKVSYEGFRVWKEERTFDVPEPAAAREFRAGEFVVRYDYPKVKVASDQPVPTMSFPYAHLRGVLRSDGTTVPWIPQRPMSFLSYPGKAKSWCFCKEGPVAGLREDPPVRSREFGSADYPNHQPAEFKSMEVVFLRKIAEPITIEGTVTVE